MKVHEIMTAHARSVAPDTTLVEAAGLMRELDVGSLPVMEGDDVAGIVTDRDIAVRGVADGMDPNVTKVSDVMSGPVEAISADEDVETAVRIMEDRRIRRLPVLDNGRRLVGIVSLGDIATSSNPAFSGLALRDVSEPNRPTARRRRLMQRSEPIEVETLAEQRRAPRGEGRGAQTRERGSSRRRSEPKPSDRRGGARSGARAKAGGARKKPRRAGRR